MIAEISVRLRKNILDPAGQATAQTLNAMGFAQVQDVRIGRLIEVTLANDTDAAQAESMAQAMGERLLANGVIEDFSVHIRKA